MGYPYIIYGVVMLLCLVAVYGLSLWKESAFSKILIVLCCAANIVYLFWRLLATLPSNGLVNQIAGVLLLATECAGLLQMLVFYTLVWKPAKEQHVPLEELDEIPTVDLMIATYNEPVAVLKRTLAGCASIDYPRDRVKIYICDDGDREEVAELAQTFGACYVTREEHLHAKAGNLNHALTQSQGEFVAIFDADMVPLKAFLTRTIGLFRDSDVAFVQTPQAFYNDDPFQYNTFSSDVIPNEQDFFMRTLQAGKARFNAVMFVGSNAIFRRSALDAIGGFATGVITEDMATGMIIQAKGYKGLFVEDVLAMGLAPETWGDLLKQRDRWCRGNIQCAKKWNPLVMPGLSLMQRILYMDGLIYWFFGIFKTVYILAPLAFLLLGVYSLQTNLIGVLTFWLPSFLGSFLSFQIVSKRKRSLIWSHIYDTSMAPHLALSALMELLFKKQPRFKVTPKGAQSGKRQFQLATVLPHLILATFTLLAFGKVAVDYLIFNRVDWQLVSVNLFWALYNLLGLIVSVMISVNQPRFRRAERFRIEREAELQFASGETHKVLIHDLNEFGARLQGTKDSFPAIPEQMTLNIENIGPIPGQRVWVTGNTESVSFAMKFDALSAKDYTDLVNYTFNENDSRRSAIEKERSSFLATSLRFMRHAFRVLTPHQRGEVRGHINEEAFVTILPKQRLDRAAYEAAAALADEGSVSFDQKVVLIDLSDGGCQIQSPFPIELKTKLLIYSAQANMGGREAEAVWSKPIKKGYLTGLRFIMDTDRAELDRARLVY